jgi:hypothetical protein
MIAKANVTEKKETTTVTSIAQSIQFLMFVYPYYSQAVPKVWKYSAIASR